VAVSVLPEGTPVPELMLWKFVIGRVVMKNLVGRFAKDESGATTIEYGLIAAGIAVAIVTVVGEIGTNLNTTFTTVSGGLQ
jgi:pilus assembly protein Flp/PilA